jgi:ParB-like chromosome segregation protein Spo0J
MEFSRGERILVDLHEIPESPGPYTMSFGFNLDGLRESIARVGLIALPLVAKNQEGPLDIVSGYRRILAMKAMGEHKILCEDMTSILASPLERLLAAFYDNLATRKFNDIEKAMILHKLQHHVGTEEIISSFMPLLSLPSHQGTLKFYLKLLDLDESLQKAIAQEEISLKLARTFVETEKSSRQTLFNWISSLKLNSNQQLKFIEYVKDISMRDGLTTLEVLSDGSLTKSVQNPQLNTPQKAKVVLEALRVRRFPRLARAQEAIAKAVAPISMPPGTSIHYDPYLEDPDYRFEIKFKHGKDLMKTINMLHELQHLEAIPELWGIVVK